LAIAQFRSSVMAMRIVSYTLREQRWFIGLVLANIADARLAAAIELWRRIEAPLRRRRNEG
jgi:uncharacterized membrane protein YidH (DUF202 family)